VFSCGWHITRDGQHVYGWKLKAIVKVPLARLARLAYLDDQVEACRRVFASETRWTVVRGRVVVRRARLFAAATARRTAPPVLLTRTAIVWPSRLDEDPGPTNGPAATKVTGVCGGIGRRRATDKPARRTDLQLCLGRGPARRETAPGSRPRETADRGVSPRLSGGHHPTKSGAGHPPIRGLTPSPRPAGLPRFSGVQRTTRSSREPRGIQTVRQSQIVKRPTRAGRDPLDLRTPTGRQLNF
jgi:hypothetical protein